MNKSSAGKQQAVDLVYLLKVFRNNLLWILVAALLAALIGGGVRALFMSTKYTTEIKFLVNGFSQTDDGLQIDVGEAGDAVNLVKAIPAVIQSDRALDAALDKLKGTAHAAGSSAYDTYTRRDVGDMIERITTNNQVVTVRITNQERQVAMDVARSIEQSLAGVLDYNLGIENESNTETRSSVIKVLNGAGDDTTTRTGLGVAGYAAVGFVIGFVLSYLVLVLFTYFDCTVHGEEELKAYFPAIPLIGQIPTWENRYGNGSGKGNTGASLSAKKKPGTESRTASASRQNDRGASVTRKPTIRKDYSGRLICPETPFAISESFKLLRTNLLYITKGENCPVYAVTSAYVDAGKSLVTANTAIAFAQMGKRVLLLDADLRCPAQHRIFGTDPRVNGLSELLAGLCKPEEVTVNHLDCGGGDLDVITSGKNPPNPAELLASQRMDQLMERYKAVYDYIFIDLPPVCEVSDAGIISRLVTGYAFVVRAGVSDRRVIASAVDTMEGYGASVGGFVLNDVNIKSGTYYHSRYHGYGKYGRYGYKYGRYAEEYGKEKRDPQS